MGDGVGISLVALQPQRSKAHGEESTSPYSTTGMRFGGGPDAVEGGLLMKGLLTKARVRGGQIEGMML